MFELLLFGSYWMHVVFIGATKRLKRTHWNHLNNMEIFFGVNNWGLGHATRSLPLIKALIREGHELTVSSGGGALHLLQDELGEDVDYSRLYDYPLPNSRYRYLMLFHVVRNITPLGIAIQREHNDLARHISTRGKYDRIISDGRYGLFSYGTPSYLLTHQLRFIAPLRSRLVEDTTEVFHRYFSRFFTRFLVPDIKDGITLSADLSHSLRVIPKERIRYIGPLTNFSWSGREKDIDLFISISGPGPQRTLFWEKVRNQLDDLTGKIVVSLGAPEDNEVDTTLDHLDNVEVFPFTDRVTHEDHLSRAKAVVSRSGYSTLMDLYSLGTPALFVPTPGQTEQEYLARHHENAGHYPRVSQDELNLFNDLTRLSDFTPLKGDCTQSVDNFLSELNL